MAMKLQRRLSTSLAVAAGLLVMASTAFACTYYNGTMIVEGSGGGISTATAIKQDRGMDFCSDPRLVQHGGTASDVAQLQAPVSGGDAIGTVVISTEEGTCNGELPSKLRAGDYRVSWNSDFSRDCMVQAGGVPMYIDPKPLTVDGSGATTGTVAERTYTIPALATGLFGYAGVCITHSEPTAGVPHGNKAPVLVL